MSLFGCYDNVEPVHAVSLQSKIEYTAKEKELINEINEYRRQNFLQECSTDNYLSSLAYEHNLYMISQGKPSHDNFNERVADIGLIMNIKTAAEIISYGFMTTEVIVNKWSKSESHRKVLENPSFNCMGLAATFGANGRLYVTNIYIKQ